MFKPLRITAHLVNGLADEPPALDALLVYELGFKMGMKDIVTRSTKPENIPWVPIPVESEKLCGYRIHKVSNPIFKIQSIHTEHYTRRFNSEKSYMIAKEERKSLLTASGPYKMKRVPIKHMLTDKIVWFCKGDKKEINKILKRITSVGRYRKMGYGIIAGWEIEHVDDDHSWFSNMNGDKILMRTLPLGKHLDNAIGWRSSYGGCCPPYWHHSRYTDIAIPC